MLFTSFLSRTVAAQHAALHRCRGPCSRYNAEPAPAMPQALHVLRRALGVSEVRMQSCMHRYLSDSSDRLGCISRVASPIFKTRLSMKPQTSRAVEVESTRRPATVECESSVVESSPEISCREISLSIDPLKDSSTAFFTVKNPHEKPICIHVGHSASPAAMNVSIRRNDLLQPVHNDQLERWAFPLCVDHFAAIFLNLVCVGT